MPFVSWALWVQDPNAEIIRVPLTPTDAESDTLGTSCEREVDSLDPLHPSTNELSGARLLIRRALKENHGGSEEQTPVPGQVPYRNTLRNTPSAASKRGKSEPRIGTATSQHTFVVETERRRPLMMNIGLGEGAMEYKKLLDAQEKAQAEAAEKEKERQKALRHLQLTSRKAPSLLKKELSSSITQLKENSKKALPSKPSSKTPLRKSPITNSGTGSSASIDLDSEAFNKRIVEQESFDDYSAVFGARPKVARTPDTQSRSFF
ncbi:unnamed protein product [Caenorhabditis auriculariae]|uniref:Uncharacterized protein n=1 Tax=Caenorhabditis auriculariae TaxID=2777116 RepID=A0A8S1HRP1_9PELO|nr:unnamed protein product [Caenorhabditis auriculariae]